MKLFDELERHLNRRKKLVFQILGRLSAIAVAVSLIGGLIGGLLGYMTASDSSKKKHSDNGAGEFIIVRK